MIALALVALLGAQQTLVIPTTAQAPSQALPASATSPQVQAPDPSTTPAVGVPVARPKTPAVTPSAPLVAARAPATGEPSSSASSLNTRDRTALPTATVPVSSSLPPGVTGGPTFGGAPAIQTGGH